MTLFYLPFLIGFQSGSLRSRLKPVAFLKNAVIPIMSKYTHDQWVQVQSPTVALGYEHTELMASAG